MYAYIVAVKPLPCLGCVALPDTNSEKKFYTNSAKIFLLKIA